MSRPFKIRSTSNYFNKIDSEEKAYILGLLYADGNNYKKERVISIGLQERDLALILKIKNILGIENKLLFYNRRNKNKNHQNIYKLTFADKQMSEDLNKWGCVYNKTFVLTFPTFLSENLIRHFIRGFFDGDGCINKSSAKGSKYKVYTFSAVGTLSMMLGIIEHLNSKLGFTIPAEKRIDPHRAYSSDNIVRANISGLKPVNSIMNYLYSDATIFLQRKYDYWQNNIIPEIINYKPYGIAINMIDPLTNEIVRTFESIKQAATYCNCTSSNIKAVLCKRTHTAKNYKWEYCFKKINFELLARNRKEIIW